MKRLLLFTICTLLLASCDTPESRIKNLAKQFMDDNMTVENRTDEVFNRIDSTTYITAKRITEMQKNATHIDFYKKNINYQSGNTTPTLLYVTVTYNITDAKGKIKKCKQTFYTDKEATHIVAFKDN